MATDNLNYYSSGLPAGQQTDKYSSQPGCLKSKNLDIFSSSKSVKATAWSEPVIGDDDIIASEGGLVLKTDGKVYERVDGVDTLLVDPSQDFPVYKVSYTGKSGTYADAEWGTPQDMSVVTENGEWKSFIVYTDRASYLYSKVKFTPEKTTTGSGWVLDTSYDDTDSVWRGSGTLSSSSIAIECEDRGFSQIPINITNLSGQQTVEKIRIQKRKYAYDAELDAMVDYNDGTEDVITSYNYGDTVYVPNIPGSTIWIFFSNSTTSSKIRLNINKSGDMDMYGHYMIGDGDSNYYYSYLPVRDHLLQRIGVYSWMKGAGFQILYHWDSSRVDVNGFKKTRYDFVQYMGWANDPGMDVIGMIEWNEQVYMIGNLSGDGYIIPCDLTGSKGTPYIAYGCEFKGVTNIDYLLYLVGEDRGVSTLWAFNQQELVPVIGGKQESKYIDRIGVDEQYKFDGKILNRRKNLILSTTDYRIFQYGQTYGGKGGAFIHELTGPVTDIKAKGNDLVVSYLHLTPRSIETWSGDVPQGLGNFDVEVYSADGNSVLGTHAVPRKGTTAESLVDEYGEADGFTGVSLTLDGDKLADDYPLYEEVGETLTLYAVPDYISATKKNTAYQDDTPIKNYNTEWMATYPIVLGNHLLEKEESDLYVSYILPSADTSLEFWGMANHYHFWTFTSGDDVTLSTSVSYKLKGATGDYSLKFIEKNGDQYTFRLEGDLPVQTTSKMKITDSEGADVLSYSKFNHFRKIGEIATTEYQEGEFRFHNLNSKLELPKSYSLQIMVKGKGTVNYTPELFSVDLVANQRNRG